MFVKPADSAHAKEPFLADWKLFDFIIITDDSALRIIQFIKKKKKTCQLTVPYRGVDTADYVSFTHERSNGAELSFGSGDGLSEEYRVFSPRTHTLKIPSKMHPSRPKGFSFHFKVSFPPCQESGERGGVIISPAVRSGTADQAEPITQTQLDGGFIV